MDEKKQVDSETKAGGETPLRSGDIALQDTDIYVDPELEKRVMRKFDRFILPQFAILMLIAYLDRSNIGEQIFNFVISNIANKAKVTPSCSA